MRKRTAEATDKPESDEGVDRQFVTSLHRGLEVLRAFRPTDASGLGNREIAERTGLPNSTVSRLTYTLLKLEYLTYDEKTGRYRVGVPVLGLGYACLGGAWLRDTAQKHMQQLADQCGDGVLVALGGRDRSAMTYIACARSQGAISLQLDVGSHISLARSAMGRAYLAGTSEAERAEIIELVRARNSPQEAKEIEAGIAEAAKQIETRGFYCSLGFWKSDVHAVSVPFNSIHGGGVPMAFNLGGPAYILPEEKLVNDFGPRLVEMVEAISRY